MATATAVMVYSRTVIAMMRVMTGPEVPQEVGRLRNEGELRMVAIPKMGTS